MKEFQVRSKDTEISCRFIEKNQRTKEIIKENLPISGRAKKYMEEVYFSTGINIDIEDASKEVEKGDIGFWPKGNAICFFYGQTDPVSPVNVFAKTHKGLNEFKKIKEEDKIKIEPK